MGGIYLLFSADYIFLQDLDYKGNGDFPCWLGA